MSESPRDAGLYDELQRMAARLRDLERDLEHSRHEARLGQLKKLESLGVLAGGVAHDFNNLLTSVLGNTDLALAHLPPASPARAHLKHIELAAQRAADLARQMLAYSGRGQFVIRPICLGDVLRARMSTMTPALPPHVALETAIPAKLPAIDGDADQLTQLLKNILANAIESMTETPRGTLRVAAGTGRCTRDQLASMYLDEHLPEGEYVWVEIGDTGCGMPPEVQARMFEPFFTTKFTGRGLGLAVVLGILRGHGGAVHVTSEPDRGTSVRVLFPARGQWNVPTADAKPVPPAPAVPAETPAAGPAGRILVIDDEETVRSVARMILERSGFSVVTAASGAEGIAAFREARGEFSAVVLDMRLPIVSSQQVCSELVGLQPDVRVILSSGYLEDDAIEGFDRRCIAGYLQKPYRFDELIACIRRVVADPAG